MPAAKRRVIDLDKLRAARAEGVRQPVSLKIGGETFQLPAEIPLDYSLRLAEGDVRGALEALLNSKCEAFFEMAPSVQDVNELIDGIESAYGVTEGE